MAGIIERLSEGVVNRDMRAEGHALLAKWERTGLLEGLGNDRKKNSMARLLENQAKELLRESTTMQAGDVEGFAAVAFPIVRRVFAGLIANDLVSVQPMSLPSGLIFFLDFTFSGDIGSGTADASRMGNTTGSSIYGTDRVGSQVTGGVNIVGTSGGDLSGPRTSARGYAYGSPSGSVVVATGDLTATVIDLSGTAGADMTNANLKKIQFDPDLLALATGAGATHRVLEVVIAASAVPTDLDKDNFAAVQALSTDVALIAANLTASGIQQVRRLQREDSSGNLALYFAGAAGAGGINVVDGALTTTGNLSGSYPQVDGLTGGGALGSVVGTTTWGLEGSSEIPEIDIKVDSIAVTAQTKKLKAKWSPELGQDLNAYHNMDAEVELTSILSEQIALEIDREILADLVNGATAATRYWSRAPGLFLDVNGNEVGASAKAPDFTGTVSEWYETLAETINDVSAAIHRKTLRGGANFLVCGPEVANILEFTAGFRASVTHDDATGSVGAVQIGSINKKWDLHVDPYFPRNVVLVGRKGSSFLESGYVYAPYVPLIVTPTIFQPDDFTPRKGVMTRYGKKMVRADFYGTVTCLDMNII